MNFLFWNTAKKDLREVIKCAAEELALDFIILCELGVSGEEYQEAVTDLGYDLHTGIEERFCVLCSCPKVSIPFKKESTRYLIFSVELTDSPPFLLVVVHGPSKASHWDSTSQCSEFGGWMQAIKEYKLKLTHHHNLDVQRMVITGDFNANPWEAGMIAANAFHAVPDARVAKKGSRIVQQTSYNFLYNPMWNLLGDNTSGPPGTHYHRSGTHIDHHWHMYDQVLVSPDLIDLMPTSEINILTEIGEHQLSTPSERPSKTQYSDHFPLSFSIEF